MVLGAWGWCLHALRCSQPGRPSHGMVVVAALPLTYRYSGCPLAQHTVTSLHETLAQSASNGPARRRAPYLPDYTHVEG